jgi:hypothetical protein
MRRPKHFKRISSSELSMKTMGTAMSALTEEEEIAKRAMEARLHKP